MDQRLRLPALLEYRARTAKRRAAAFCDVPDYVLDIPVQPLTPATFSMLFAAGNAFVTGASPQERDVREYLWFHSDLWVHGAAADWWQRKRRALAPLEFALWPRVRRWLGLKPDRNHVTALLALAIADIQELLENAFADAPAKSARPTKSVASLEGFFVHEFASAYGWPPERTRHTPLRQLMQLHRCIRAARGDELDDQGEAEILAAHLKARNDALAAERAKKQQQEGASHG